MRITSLLYHDVVEHDQFGLSGFSGAGPDSYKLEKENFKAHMEATAQWLAADGMQLDHWFKLPNQNAEDMLLITFDDGGISFLTEIADILEAHAIPGIFFISTKYLGTDHFLTNEQLKQLRERGHIIGSHSHTHPKIMSDLSYEELLEEWKTSKDLLSNILDEEITIASVPGGYFSEDVAKAADEAGYKVLFTSEPTNKITRTGNCLISGRYSLKQEDLPERAVQIVQHNSLFSAKEFIFWNAKKILKNVLGKKYLKIRERLLK